MGISQNNDIRLEYKSKRDKLSSDYIEDSSNRIINNLTALLESDFKGANIFLCFYPHGSEVTLLSFYKELLNAGKKLYFPKCQRDYELIFRQVTNLDTDFENGFKGIKEPKDSLPALENYSIDTVAITPGLVFDLTFNRIGYGKGFYDRFFAAYPMVIKVAVAYDFQVLHKIPSFEHDAKMDYIVTDVRILKG